MHHYTMGNSGEFLLEVLGNSEALVGITVTTLSWRGNTHTQMQKGNMEMGINGGIEELQGNSIWMEKHCRTLYIM